MWCKVPGSQYIYIDLAEDSVKQLTDYLRAVSVFGSSMYTFYQFGSKSEISVLNFLLF